LASGYDGSVKFDTSLDSSGFPTVDTGVSGRAAVKVAHKLFQVSKGRQVLCVTHLPQIAAMADTHFSVKKGEKKGRTFTQVERLDQEGRTDELARLIGGAEVTDVLRQSAAQLLEQAGDYHKKKSGT